MRQTTSVRRVDWKVLEAKIRRLLDSPLASAFLYTVDAFIRALDKT